MSRLAILVFTLISYSTQAANDASSAHLTSVAAVEAMEQAFFRSEKVHSESMASIMRSMSPQKAWQVLEKHRLSAL